MWPLFQVGALALDGLQHLCTAVSRRATLRGRISLQGRVILLSAPAPLNSCCWKFGQKFKLRVTESVSNPCNGTRNHWTIGFGRQPIFLNQWEYRITCHVPTLLWVDCKADYSTTLVDALPLLSRSAAQAFNFTRIPVEHQLLAVNGMTLIDACFLSWARSQVRCYCVRSFIGGCGLHVGGWQVAALVAQLVVSAAWSVAVSSRE